LIGPFGVFGSILGLSWFYVVSIAMLDRNDPTEAGADSASGCRRPIA
jgi:hypothetical protein